jgi:hypothetical protein
MVDIHCLLGLAEAYLEWENLIKLCRDNQSTHFTLSNFFTKSCGLYGAENNFGARKAIACLECWKIKLKPTHSEYVIFNAFPRQHRLRESTTVLRHTYSASTVPSYIRLLCTSTVCSVYCVPSVIMCSTALILPFFSGNCIAVWDAVSLLYTCTEGSVSVTCTTINCTHLGVRTYW